MGQTYSEWYVEYAVTSRGRTIQSNSYLCADCFKESFAMIEDMNGESWAATLIEAVVPD